MRVRLIIAMTLVSLAGGLLAAPGAGAAKGGGKFFGLIPQRSQMEQVDMGAINDLRVKAVRFLIVFEQVQSGPGPCLAAEIPTDNCYWGEVDRLVGRAAAAGATATPFIFGSLPQQTGDAFRPPLATPDQRESWKQFLRALAGRYGPNGEFWRTTYPAQFPGAAPKPIRIWQIWNEPGSPAYYHPKPNPRSYAELLKISRQALRAVDSGAKVMIAGLFASPDRGAIRGRIPAVQYLDRLYDVRGVKGFFDIVAVHPYSRSVAGLFEVIRGLRREMREAGDARTRLSISELGWSSNRPNGSLLAKGVRGQARTLRSAFTRLWATRGQYRLLNVFWFSLRDIDPNGPGSCPNCPWTGLLNLDGSKKPSYTAFRSFTR